MHRHGGNNDMQAAPPSASSSGRSLRKPPVPPAFPSPRAAAAAAAAHASSAVTVSPALSPGGGLSGRSHVRHPSSSALSPLGLSASDRFKRDENTFLSRAPAPSALNANGISSGSPQWRTTSSVAAGGGKEQLDRFLDSMGPSSSLHSPPASTTPRFGAGGGGGGMLLGASGEEWGSPPLSLAGIDEQFLSGFGAMDVGASSSSGGAATARTGSSSNSGHGGHGSPSLLAFPPLSPRGVGGGGISPGGVGANSNSPASGSMNTPRAPAPAHHHARRPSYMQPTLQEAKRQAELREAALTREKRLESERQKTTRRAAGLTASDLYQAQQSELEARRQAQVDREERQRNAARQEFLAKLEADALANAAAAAAGASTARAARQASQLASSQASAAAAAAAAAGAQSARLQASMDLQQELLRREGLVQQDLMQRRAGAGGGGGADDASESSSSDDDDNDSDGGSDDNDTAEAKKQQRTRRRAMLDNDSDDDDNDGDESSFPNHGRRRGGAAAAAVAAHGAKKPSLTGLGMLSAAVQTGASKQGGALHPVTAMALARDYAALPSNPNPAVVSGSLGHALAEAAAVAAAGSSSSSANAASTNTGRARRIQLVHSGAGGAHAGGPLLSPLSPGRSVGGGSNPLLAAAVAAHAGDSDSDGGDAGSSAHKRGGGAGVGNSVSGAPVPLSVSSVADLYDPALGRRPGETNLAYGVAARDLTGLAFLSASQRFRRAQKRAEKRHNNNNNNAAAAAADGAAANSSNKASGIGGGGGVGLANFSRLTAAQLERSIDQVEKKRALEQKAADSRSNHAHAVEQAQLRQAAKPSAAATGGILPSLWRKFTGGSS